MNKGKAQHDLSYWEQMAERYFQAETTEAEEAQLRDFLSSSLALDARFDEIRATVSFLSVSRPKKSGHSYPLKALAIAACLCIAAFLGWYQYQQYNISNVRVAGETVEVDASLLMQQQMAEVMNPVDSRTGR